MKKLFYVAAAALMAAACGPKDGYVITGQLTSGDEDQLTQEIYFMNRNAETPVSDTLQMKDGAFRIQGKVERPEYYYIVVGNERIPLFLENDQYQVKGEIGKLRSTAEVTGGESQTLFNLRAQKENEIYEAIQADSLQREYASASDERREEIIALFNQAREDVEAFNKQLLAEHHETYYALMDFSRNLPYLDLEEVEAEYAFFSQSPKFTGDPTLETIREYVEKLRELQPGKQAPDFTMNGPDGKPVTLSDVYRKNKVTMIDFWAGWCGPCRAFNPKLVKIYKEFHKQGFEVLGVSLDRDEKTWKDAIRNDKLTWPQVSDLKYWDTEVAKTYNVRYIPQNIFVDQNGVILARTVSEEDIVDFLKEHLD